MSLILSQNGKAVAFGGSYLNPSFEGSVRYDIAQNLSDEQKNQAKTNLGIAEKSAYIFPIKLSYIPDTDSYITDKTYEEIFAAYDTGKILILVPDDSVEDWPSIKWALNISSLPLIGGGSAFEFGAAGFIPESLVFSGGKQERISIDCIITSTDVSVEVVPRIDISPQKWIFPVQESNGVIKSQATYDRLSFIIANYNSNNLQEDFNIFGIVNIQANFNGNFYDLKDKTDSTIIFSTATKSGIETLTLTNKDVWTHTVENFDGGGMFINITASTENGETIYSADKTYDEIMIAVNNGILPVCNFLVQDSYGPKNIRCTYVNNFYAPRMTEYALFISLGAEQYWYEIRITDQNQVNLYSYSLNMRQANREMQGGCLVPVPDGEEKNKFLRGDATWADVPSSLDKWELIQTVPIQASATFYNLGDLTTYRKIIVLSEQKIASSYSGNTWLGVYDAANNNRALNPMLNPFNKSYNYTLCEISRDDPFYTFTKFESNNLQTFATPQIMKKTLPATPTKPIVGVSFTAETLATLIDGAELKIYGVKA